ncbi:MAG: ComEA family DNA-binding protein [Gaiellaceae bacterium]|nr:ComEA family DNA-binding protein [Gaiellaceae bacterium]
MPELPVSRRQALVVAAVLLALLVVAGKLLGGAGAASAEPPALVQAEAPAAAKLVVHVAGAVRQPGLYELADGSRVSDAVARAGGATAKADTAAVNLAAPLADGIQVLIPSRVAGPAGAGAAAGAGAEGAPGRRVSLSSATLAELDALPGVGPVTAQKILDHRAQHGGFSSVDDLDAISGIGPARIEQLRELVTP